MAIVVITAIPVGSQVAVDEAEIYTQALRAAIGFKATDGRRLSVQDRTAASGQFWRGLETGLPAPVNPHPRVRMTYAKPETIDAFLAKSDSELPLPPEFRKAAEFQLISRSEATAAFQSGQKRQFARRHRVVQGASASVSAIGVDQAGEQAVVFVNYTCGTLCGHGAFVLLERRGEHWVVATVDHFIEY